MTKYLKAEEIAQLKKEEEDKCKVEARSAFVLSKRSIESKKSLPTSQAMIKNAEITSTQVIIPQRQTKNQE